MAQNNISIPAARGNFLTWCISGYMPLNELCRPLYVAQKLTTADEAVVGEYYPIYSVNEARGQSRSLQRHRRLCQISRKTIFP